MKIIAPKVLANLRQPGRCAWCKNWHEFLDPHHLNGRGLGGGKRLDVPWAILSLCRFCHNDVHAGKILRGDLLAIAAARVGCQQGDIESALLCLRTLPAGPLPSHIKYAMTGLTRNAKRLVRRALEQAGVAV